MSGIKHRIFPLPPGVHYLMLAPILLAAGVASALEVEWTTEHRFFAEELPLELLLTRVRATETSTESTGRAVYQGRVSVSLRGRPVDALGLELGLDSGLFEIGRTGVFSDGQKVGEHARQTFFLGQTLIDLELGDTGVVAIRAGKKLTRIADGVLFDGYALGLDVDVDLSLLDPDSPWRARLDAILPDATFTASGKQSPLFALKLGYVPSRSVDLWLLGAVFLDGDDNLGAIVTDAAFRGRYGELCEILARRRGVAAACDGRALEVTTSGALGWIGGGISYDQAPLDLALTGVLGLGHSHSEFTLIGTARPVAAEIGYASGLVSLTAGLSWAEHLRVGAYGLLVSGDDGFGTLSLNQTHHGFVSLSPRLGYTRIFFNGGLATTLQSLNVTSVSPDGAGLLSGGLNVALSPIEALRFFLTGAVMSALFPSPSTGAHLLGAELNGAVEYRFTEGLSARGEVAGFLPGRYYGEIRGGFQVMLGLSWAGGPGA